MAREREKLRQLINWGQNLPRAWDVIDAAIENARTRGARTIYLESNTKLTPALRLYEKAGFRHLAEDERPTSPYERCNVFMSMRL